MQHVWLMYLRVCASADAELFQQLALFKPGKSALREAAATVNPALQTVVARGLSSEARRTARTVLDLLTTAGENDFVLARPSSSAHGREQHVMMSYQWEHQDLVLRLSTDLKAVGFNMWLDVEQMQGSTVESMADAVERAAVMLICISKPYKESPNCRYIYPKPSQSTPRQPLEAGICSCRMEANYGMQRQKDMVPLMFEADYEPTGCATHHAQLCSLLMQSPHSITRSFACACHCGIV